MIVSAQVGATAESSACADEKRSPRPDTLVVEELRTKYWVFEKAACSEENSLQVVFLVNSLVYLQLGNWEDLAIHASACGYGDGVWMAALGKDRVILHTCGY